jgi:hypothetical protein
MEIFLSLLAKNDDDKVNKKIVEIRINRNPILSKAVIAATLHRRQMRQQNM